MDREVAVKWKQTDKTDKLQSRDVSNASEHPNNTSKISQCKIDMYRTPSMLCAYKNG